MVTTSSSGARLIKQMRKQKKNLDVEILVKPEERVWTDDCHYRFCYNADNGSGYCGIHYKKLLRWHKFKQWILGGYQLRFVKINEERKEELSSPTSAGIYD